MMAEEEIKDINEIDTLIPKSQKMLEDAKNRNCIDDIDYYNNELTRF